MQTQSYRERTPIRRGRTLALLLVSILWIGNISRAEKKLLQENYRIEVTKLAGNSAIQSAFQHIQEIDAASVEELITLTQIPAPPFQEAERGKAYRKLLEGAGADQISTDSVGNVIAVRKGTKGDRVIVLSAHLDTVFPEGTDVTVKRENDRLLAPGIADDTRGLILILNVLRAMNYAKIRTEADVWLVATVGEEGLGDLRGVKHLFKEHGTKISGFITVDGSGDSGMTSSAIGSRRYRVTFSGPGGHSWAAFGTVNPAHALGRAIDLFTKKATEYTASGERTSFNVGRIGGGTSVNSIPFESWMEIDMRSVSAERLKGIDAILHSTVNQALSEMNQERKRGDELKVSLDLVGDRPSGQIPVSASLVQRSMAAITYFGLEPKLDTGSTDANIPISMGIPGIRIGGGGRSGGSHSLSEWWSNDNGHLGIQRTLLTVVAEAGLASEP